MTYSWPTFGKKPDDFRSRLKWYYFYFCCTTGSYLLQPWERTLFSKIQLNKFTFLNNS